MKNLIIFLFFAGLPAFVTLSSCKSETPEKSGTELAENMMEQATGAEIELENGGANVTIEGNNEKVQINQQTSEWPSEVVPDVPQLPDGEIIRVIKSETPDKYTWNLYYKPLPAEKIIAYGDVLKENGFEIMKMQLPKGGQVSGQKGEVVVMCMYGKETCVLSIQQPK